MLSQEAKRDRRKAEYDQVVALAGQNLAYKQMAVETGVSVDTISRWLRADEFPEWGGGVPIRRPSKLDKYESYMRKRWTEGYRNATELYKEITKQGVRGFAAGEEVLRQGLEGEPIEQEAAFPTTTSKASGIPASSPRLVAVPV